MAVRYGIHEDGSLKSRRFAGIGAFRWEIHWTTSPQTEKRFRKRENAAAILTKIQKFVPSARLVEIW